MPLLPETAFPDLPTMTKRIFPSLLAIALASPVAATPGSVRDFQLPTPSPTATPELQGPVDIEGAPVASRANPTTAPSPATAPSAVPTGTATPETTATRAASAPPSPAPSSARDTPPNTVSPPRFRPTPTPPATPRTNDLLPAQETPDASASQPSGTADLDTAPTELPGNPAPQEAQSVPLAETEILGFNRNLWLAAIAALMALITGIWFARRRNTRSDNAGAPQSEPPATRDDQANSDSPTKPAETPLRDTASSPSPPFAHSASPAKKPTQRQPVEAGKAAGSLQIKAEALSLSRSLMNATLAYRFELHNSGSTELKEISVRTDVVTAHSQAPIEEQIADAHTDLQYMGMVASIPAGQKHEFRGEFRLPINAIRTITQGRATLYVPLLRLRVDADGLDPIISTLVVGIKPPVKGAKLQPFRLDEMAQTYRNIGMRAV